jgi:hypothetical protein
MDNCKRCGHLAHIDRCDADVSDEFRCICDNGLAGLLEVAQRILSEIDLMELVAPAGPAAACVCPGDWSASAAGWSPFCFEHGDGPYTIEALPVFRTARDDRRLLAQMNKDADGTGVTWTGIE